MNVAMSREEFRQAIDEAIDQRLARQDDRTDRVLTILESIASTTDAMADTMVTLVETASNLQTQATTLQTHVTKLRTDVGELVRLHKNFKQHVL